MSSDRMLIRPQLKRLSRPEEPRGRFQLTERDVEIVRFIARVRFASLQQIVDYLALTEPTTSYQQVSRRVMGLFDRSYIERPEQQYLQLRTSSSLVYGLGKQGAHLLAAAGFPIDPHLQWAGKSSRASNVHINHTIETTEALLAFEKACRALPGYRFLDHADLLTTFPAPTRQLHDPFRLRITVQDGFKAVPLNVIPDRLCAIARPDGKRHNFPLEIDRANMSVDARTLTGKSSYRRKLTAYFAAWEQAKHAEQWAMQSFRVLSIVPSHARIENMLTMQVEKVTHGRVPNLFLYTTPQRIAEHGALSPIWRSAERDNISIIEPVA